MGACTFGCSIKNQKNANEAFANAKREAQHESGHGGYSGTIAEKSSFKMIPLPAGKSAGDYAYELIEAGDKRIDNKWGPAGCFDLGNGEFYFFGWASE